MAGTNTSVPSLSSASQHNDTTSQVASSSRNTALQEFDSLQCKGRLWTSPRNEEPAQQAVKTTASKKSEAQCKDKEKQGDTEQKQAREKSSFEKFWSYVRWGRGD
jgi:hypothetical protein